MTPDSPLLLIVLLACFGAFLAACYAVERVAHWLRTGRVGVE